MAPPSAICEFASSSSPRWTLNRAVLETGANNMVSRTKSARSWCLRYSPLGHAVNMLTEERRAASDT